MDRKNNNRYQEICGEEWLWPMVEDVIDTLVEQQVIEVVMDEKTEEQVRMEKYIVENILESDDVEEDLLPFDLLSSPLPTSHASFLSSHSTSSPTTITTRYQVSSSSNIIFQPTTLTMSSYCQPPPPTASLFRSFNPSNMPLPSSGRVRRNSTRDYCGFCKRNGEIASIYTSHHLFDQQGRVECPQLRVLVCELCGATGDNAHTRNYCPSNTEASRVALPTLLKSTPRQSDGRWRRRGGR